MLFTAFDNLYNGYIIIYASIMKISLNFYELVYVFIETFWFTNMLKLLSMISISVFYTSPYDSRGYAFDPKNIAIFSKYVKVFLKLQEE